MNLASVFTVNTISGRVPFDIHNSVPMSSRYRNVATCRASAESGLDICDLEYCALSSIGVLYSLIPYLLNTFDILLNALLLSDVDDVAVFVMMYAHA